MKKMYKIRYEFQEAKERIHNFVNQCKFNVISKIVFKYSNTMINLPLANR